MLSELTRFSIIVNFLGYIYGHKDIRMGHSDFRTILKSYFQRLKFMGKLLSLLDHVTNWRRYISTSTSPTTTKLGMVVTQDKGLPHTKLYVPLIMRSRDVT